MPTRNRRPFVGQAIWYFLRQDYPRREMIVVDDGEDSVADLIPPDERIHYLRLDRRHSLGIKRNIACEMSQGSLIAHWDDDDWMAPHRLSLQVAALNAANAAACGVRELLHYRIDAGEAWLYRYPPEMRPWLAGCTLMYRRDVWVAHPFPDANVGEDTAFVWAQPPAQLLAMPDCSFYVALIHPGNSAPKHLAGPRWERRSLQEVADRLHGDRYFYASLRGGNRVQRSTLRHTTTPITVCAPFNVSTGYGSMAEYLVLGLERAGATVTVMPLGLNLDGMTPEFELISRRSPSDAGGPVLYFHWPRSTDLDRFGPARDLFINTMFEGSRLPAGWTERLNRARAVIVPTHFVARACRDSGVRVPIEVIPEGIDPDVYHFEQRPERSSPVTLMVGPIDDRKHVLVGVASWKEVFAGDPDARLIIKTQYGFQNYTPDDPRIQYVDRIETTRGIAHWYREADLLLALGNEGFGLPMVEAMATGLPVIALNSEGQTEVCTEAGDCVLTVEPAEWKPFRSDAFGLGGVRGVPAVSEVVEKLRWVIAHRTEARDLGRRASAWAMAQRNIWAKAPAVLAVMEQFGRATQPLRRTYSLWTPSWGSPCGIAEYSNHLVQSLPHTRVTAEQPDLRGVRLLHVQHEPSITNDVDLEHTIQEAHQLHVPVVVTEHAVDGAPRAWERDADVLVALTQRGASMLQQRWPAKRIEYIPIGCPTWFPPRKVKRGRTIGAFGFLQRHKGFWQLLDVLHTLPGTELLLLSHARSPELESQWKQDSKGLPVRRVSEFLPVEEAARYLAAEADILVFWYDEFAHASASAAARVGLATGVPLLTSPTNWFAELRDVTYQPNDLSEGIQHLLDDSQLRTRLTTAARDFCQTHSWPRIAERHLALWRTLESA